MKQPLNIPRLCVEILATILLAEMLVMLIPSVAAPGVEGIPKAVLDATMLTLLAGPVIVWRLLAAVRRAGTTVDLPKTGKPWRLMVSAACVLALGLIVTGVAVRVINREIEREANTRFGQLSERLMSEAQSRVTQSRYGMAGVRGVYAASKSVERAEFEAYVASRDLPNDFPGAIGFGFIERVMRTDVDAFVTGERADGAPDFALWSLATPGSPLEHTPDLYVIKHCFPKERNAPVWGLDIGSDPIRREAAERAVASGQPALSGQITLWQDGKDQKGFIYLLPVYKDGTAPKTPEERKAALTGLVYTPIILDEALAGVVDSVNGNLDFDIFDGELLTEANQLYGLDRNIASADGMIEESNPATPMFRRATPMTFGGKTWTFITSTTPKFDASVDRTASVIMGTGGAVLSVLLAGIVWALGSGRAHAMTLAQSMTAELATAKAAAERLAEIARRTSNAVIIADPNGCLEWVNEGFTRTTGYTLDEVRGRKPEHLLQGAETDQAALARLRHAFATGTAATAELVYHGKNGRAYTVAAEVAPLHDETGKLTGFMAIESDITEREAARAALAVSEAKVRAIIDASPVPMAINEHDRITFLNPAFIRRFGYDLTDIPTLADWWPKAYPDEAYRESVARSWQAEIAKSARTGEAFAPMELRVRSKSGAEVVALVNAEPIRDGSEGTVLVMFYDITERKRTELELARATAMLERTGELAQVGGWSVDLRTMKLTWTLQTFRIAEIEPPNEPNLENGINLFAPEARPVVAAAVQAAMDTGTPYDLEVPLITAKGRHRWVKTQGYAEMDDGKAIRLYGTFQDITASRQAKMELLEITERFELATRAGGVGTWEYRVLDNNLTWDDQMFRLYGISREEFGGAYGAWRSGVHPDDRTRCDDEIQRALRGEKQFDTEFRVVWRDGSTRYIRGIATVQRDEAGRPVRMVGTSWDVTEKRQDEERLRATNIKLNEARQAAEAANQAKSAFLANMSHEIRTPLTAILGFTDLLRDDGNIAAAPAHRVHAIDTIKNAGQHLLTVINDILDLSKIEADKMTIERIDTPLVGLLHEVESLMRPRASGKGLSLTTTLATPVPDRVLGDPVRLRQILMNLVGNAVKFTEAGRVTITAGVEETGGPRRLVIDVEDTGPGMTKKQADSLFQVFGQADETMTRRFGGTGLGLTICRRLAALMGGDTQLLRTEQGKGSCFRLALPFDAAPGAVMVTRLDARTVAAASGEVSVKLSGRILLAEDGVDNQRLISFHLRKAGAAVDVAENGCVALEMIDRAAAANAPYDLLVTDMQMPEMDGYALAAELRKRGSTMAIVALTAHAMSEDRSKCTEAGCDDYATKPIDKAKLLSTCAAWIGARGGAQATRAAA